MLHKICHYWWRRLSHKKPIRLAMTLLVKNEVDIIEDNIRYHAKQGVDCFAVMDNGSDDGTRELLQSLKSEFDLDIIDQPEQNYQQAKWMTELAFYARDEMAADLVISNDADEFWSSNSGGSLKEHLRLNESVVTVKRHNMALSEEALKPNFHYMDTDLVVKNPIFYDSNAQINDAAVAMLLIKISPKTIINPYGLVRLKGGNHRAKHGWRLVNKRDEANITVYHYPIRNYQQFKANIENRKRLLETTNAQMGDHYRRWVRILDEGGLEEEFKRFILVDNEIDVLIKLGVLKRSKVVSL